MNIDPRKRSQSKPFPSLFSRKKGQVISPTGEGRIRSMSIKVPLGDRLKQCKATDKLIKTHILATEEVVIAGDELRRHEKDVADSLKKYSDEHIPKHFGSQQQHDLADMMNIVATTMENLAQLRTKYNHNLHDDVIAPLKNLELETSKIDSLNANQLDTETQYIIRLRDAAYVKVRIQIS
jgi:hypothetical protein